VSEQGETTIWERVDEPVLRWVASLPGLTGEMYDLEVGEAQPFEHVPGLDSAEVDASLRRLLSHGLVDGRVAAATQTSLWSSLRVTAHGLIYLGEWPDLDRVASALSLHGLLRALAEQAGEDASPALRRAAGVVSRTSDDVLRGTASELAHDLGKEIAGG
jgi:hypothetical protein